MARHWRRLALAALAAAALALTGALAGVDAQTSAKTKAAAKKSPAKTPEPAAASDDSEEELKPKAAAKRKKQDPAEAQRAVEAAGKLLESGKADQAAQALTATLAGGNLPPAIMAKALLYRGMAYRQQQKSAQAISDLTSAMWLKGGLSPADRTSALQQRASAYQEAGLSESGEPLVAALPRTTTTTTTTTTNTQAAARPAQPSAATSSNWGAATTTTTAVATTNSSAGSGSQQPQAGASGGGWNLFGGLFGGGSSAQQEQPKPTTAASAKSVPEPKASSWASNTEVRNAPATKLETAAIAAKPEGRFRVQVAMVRSQDEAVALAARVKRDYAGVLAAREPEIDQAVVGNMGTFYRVRVGPFASQNEGQNACARLKGSGLDCLVVTQ